MQNSCVVAARRHQHELCHIAFWKGSVRQRWKPAAME